MKLFKLLLLLILLCLFGFFVYFCMNSLINWWKKKKENKPKTFVKGNVDDRSLAMLKNCHREKVQPDVQAIALNTEKQKLSETNLERQQELKTKKYLGKLRYKVDYDFNNCVLSVTVIEAKDLPGLDMSGTSDPYVQVYLSPNAKEKFATKIHYQNLNPKFNETFYFKLFYTEISIKTVVLDVYDYDCLSSPDNIGYIKIPLCRIDLTQTREEWRDLTGADSEPDINEQLGELCFSLRYSPTAKKVSVVVLEAKNLKKMDVAGLSDPYVKIELLLNGKKLKKKKTSIKKNTLNPYYNETFTFEIAAELLDKVQMVLTVIDYDFIGTSDVIGKVVIGYLESDREQQHWMDMVATPRRSIARWHSLREPDKQNR